MEFNIHNTSPNVCQGRTPKSPMHTGLHRVLARRNPGDGLMAQDAVARSEAVDGAVRPFPSSIFSPLQSLIGKIQLSKLKNEGLREWAEATWCWLE